MSARLTAAALLLVGSAAAGCGPDDRSGVAVGAPTPGDTSAPADRLVLVSGRDDHGMVAEERVPVYDAPEGARVVGTVRDATYARVLDTDGQWLEVETVEGGRTVRGWVDDFFLRGESRLVGRVPSCSVALAGERRAGGTLVVVRDLRGDRVEVEAVSEPTASGWVRRSLVQELPPQGDRCGDVPPDDRHAHHQ